MKRARGHSDDPSRVDGFSLIEMLLVLAILALVSSLFLPSFGRTREMTSEQIAHQIHAVFLKAHTNAISRGSLESVQIDLQAREVSYGSASIEIPAGLRVDLRVGRELLAAGGAATLLFFPDGGSSGAEMAFTDQRKKIASVAVPWLTGIPALVRNP